MTVADLDDVEGEACGCDFSFVVLSVAGFESVHAQRGELIELRPRQSVRLAA